MCTANTCRRRRRQAAIHYRHMAKQRRPHFKMTDATTSANRLAALIAKQQQMRMRKGKK